MRARSIYKGTIVSVIVILFAIFIYGVVTCQPQDLQYEHQYQDMHYENNSVRIRGDIPIRMALGLEIRLFFEISSCENSDNAFKVDYIHTSEVTRNTADFPNKFLFPDGFEGSEITHFSDGVRIDFRLVTFDDDENEIAFYAYILFTKDTNGRISYITRKTNPHWVEEFTTSYVQVTFN